MKVRNGFVSNSSSSSFTVFENTSLDVFKKMMNIYLDDIKNWINEDLYNERKKIIEKFVDDHPYYNGNILIPFTVNYETFILAGENGEVRVDTCNNHPWFDGLEYRYHSCDEHFIDRHDDETEFIDITDNKLKTKEEVW